MKLDQSVRFFRQSVFLVDYILAPGFEPHFVHFAHTTLSRSWLTLGITCGCALLLLIVGEYAGAKFKTKLMHHKADKVDRGLGTLVGAVMLLGTVWIICGILISLPFASLQSQLRGSAIVRILDQRLPSAPNVLADLSHTIDPNGFPKVFIGVEPAPLNPNVNLPSLGVLTAAVAKDEPSVVKIEGVGCGGIVEGSGFVVAPDTVVTNAHVVAGVAHPYIDDQSVQLPATVIRFDPNLDLAILKTHNLSGSPLTVADTTVKNGPNQQYWVIRAVVILPPRQLW